MPKPADLRHHCRRAGLHIGTIDAPIAQLCIANDLTLLTTDGDFTQVTRHAPLRV
jgi:predicted nucleic acid-binding protein